MLRLHGKIMSSIKKVTVINYMLFYFFTYSQKRELFKKSPAVIIDAVVL